ncbi:MAG: DegT/DnrJ/EryC1/StrS family aminotransferase [Thermonemataceae bacterium]
MISVFGSNFGQEEIEAASKTISAQWVGIGKQVQAFEEKFAAFIESDNFLLVDSGSNALFMAVKLLDLPPASEIILPSFTWVACAQAVLMAGHRPVFCDVERGTQNVSAATIKPHITPKTGAIMVVHYAGKPVDISPILALGIPVIEDAAHAVAARHLGKACGTLGDVGIYSFDSVKNLAMGEGGGITCKNASLLQKARQWRYCGIGKSGFQQATHTKTPHRWWEYTITDPFIKMLPTDLEASIGLVQLDKLAANQAKRKQIWQQYQKAFAPINWIICPEETDTEAHGYFSYFIQVPERDQLAHYLLENKIYTTLRYHPLHLNKVYASSTPLPNCEHLNETGLNIPLHPRLTAEEVAYVIEKIINFRA